MKKKLTFTHSGVSSHGDYASVAEAKGRLETRTWSGAWLREKAEARVALLLPDPMVAYESATLSDLCEPPEISMNCAELVRLFSKKHTSKASAR